VKQFTQTDPMPLGAGSAFEGSYVYGMSSPFSFTDPSGNRGTPAQGSSKKSNPIERKTQRPGNQASPDDPPNIDPPTVVILDSYAFNGSAEISYTANTGYFPIGVLYGLWTVDGVPESEIPPRTIFGIGNGHLSHSCPSGAVIDLALRLETEDVSDEGVDFAVVACPIARAKATAAVNLEPRKRKKKEEKTVTKTQLTPRPVVAPVPNVY
jgi:hypothetical protein